MERKSSDGGRFGEWFSSALRFTRLGFEVVRRERRSPSLLMLLVWHTIGQKSSGSGHLLHWHVVRMFYCITDLTMLNTVNFGGFVTLTLAEFVTPKQVFHWLVVDSECDSVEFNLRSHVAQAKV